MATKRGFIHGLLALTAALVAFLTSAGAAGPASAAQLTKGGNLTSPTLARPQTQVPLRGSVTVHLYNGLVASLTGIPNAGLTLTASGGLIAAKAVTNKAGDAMLVAVPGVYKLHVYASGYQAVHMEIKISGYTSDLRIAMTPIPTTDPWVPGSPTDN